VETTELLRPIINKRDGRREEGKKQNTERENNENGVRKSEY
jgi:hypothetical protein